MILYIRKELQQYVATIQPAKVKISSYKKL